MSANATIQAEREALPIYSVRNKLIETIMCSKHRVSIIVGATGSGKSTQLPQYFLDLYKHVKHIKRITITQPRRVAAISLAARVAQERNVTLGEEVGYTVRFNAKTSKATKIRYATDGIVIREALLDPYFWSDSIVIVDEAHERSLNTDLLLGFLKTALTTNKHLHVIVMSATISAGNFARYFKTNTILAIQGRQYPIRHLFTLEPVKSYKEACVNTALQICRDSEPGDVLVFLPGEAEIRSVVADLQEQCDKFGVLHRSEQSVDGKKGRKRKSRLKGLLNDDSGDDSDGDGDNGSDNKASSPAYTKPPAIDTVPVGRPDVVLPAKASSIEVLPFYANLSNSEQMLVFTQTDENVRRIVVATNIAETSITIPNVRYVIDCGFVRKKCFYHNTGMSELITMQCSQAAILQRAGRAGRLMAGECYHVYTHEAYASLDPQDAPEIMLTDLMPAFLTMIAFGITNPAKYDFITEPPLHAKKAAIVKLARMNCIQVDKQTEEESVTSNAEPKLILSKLGRNVVHFPTEPELAIAILTAHKFSKKIVKDVIAIVSLLSCDGVFVSSGSIDMQEQITPARVQFNSIKGDHITLLNIWRAYNEETSGKRDWCARYFLSYRALEYAKSISKQLYDVYRSRCKSLMPKSRGHGDQSNNNATSGNNAISGHDNEVELMEFNDDEDKVLYCLLKGYISNTARRSSDKRTYEGLSGECLIHPSSCLNSAPEYVLYHEIVKTSCAYMRTVSEIDSAWIKDR